MPEAEFASILFTLYCAQSLQSCPTLCNPMDHRPPGSSDHEILQARILEWAAMPFSRESSRPRNPICVSCVYCITGIFFIHWATWETHYVGLFANKSSAVTKSWLRRWINTHTQTHTQSLLTTKTHHGPYGKICRTREMIHYSQNLGGITDVVNLFISEIR